MRIICLIVTLMWRWMRKRCGERRPDSPVSRPSVLAAACPPPAAPKATRSKLAAISRVRFRKFLVLPMRAREDAGPSLCYPVRQRDWLCRWRPQPSVTHPPLPLVFCLGRGFSRASPAESCVRRAHTRCRNTSPTRSTIVIGIYLLVLSSISDSTSTRQFAPVSSLSAARETSFV